MDSPGTERNRYKMALNKFRLEMRRFLPNLAGKL